MPQSAWRGATFPPQGISTKYEAQSSGACSPEQQPKPAAASLNLVAQLQSITAGSETLLRECEGLAPLPPPSDNAME